MQQSSLRFAGAVLATWRVTHLVNSEDGPGEVIVRMRARLGHGQLGELADCFYCLSLWVGAPLALWSTRGLARGAAWRRADRLVAWLAISGGACLLEQLTRCDRTELVPAKLTEGSKLTEGQMTEGDLTEGER